MNYTKTPNVILEAMPSMTHVEAKLTAVLIRHTFGWHTPECKLTWDEMVALAGLSKGSIAKAMDEVERRGFFMRGRKSVWRVNSSFYELFTVQEMNFSTDNELEKVQEMNSESSNFEQNQVEESSKFEPYIYKKKDFKESERKAATTAAALESYQNNIGMITPLISAEIEKYSAKLNEQWVIDAIVEAVKAGVYRWNYIQAILDRWQVEGRGNGRYPNGSPPPQQQSPDEIIAAALAARET